MRVSYRFFNRIAAAIMMVAPVAAFAQAYPAARPITIIVPSAAGGLIDVICRAMAQPLGEALKQRVLVDNKAGGNLIIGTEYVARAAPDGYTILATTVGPVSAYPHLYAKLPYDPAKDLAPLAMQVFASQIFVVPANLPVKNIHEFIAYAKANRGKMNYGSTGVGAASHLLMSWFNSRAGIESTHIAYKGNAPAQSAMMAGEIQAAFLSMQGPLPLIRAGKLKALGIGAAQRSRLLPDVDTLAKQGFEGFEGQVWFGLMAPRATPVEILRMLNTEINKILRDPQFDEKWISSQGLDAAPMTLEEMAAFLARNREDAARMVRLANAKVE